MSGPSVLDYARYYDLATDAQSQNLLGSIEFGLISDNDCLDELRDPSYPDYDDLLRDEKLQMSCEAISLLTECTRSPPAPDWCSVLNCAYPSQRFKVEMPMLMSDHMRDMRWFKKGVDLPKLLQRDFRT